MLFLPLKHTVSFCYGRFRFFGSHFAGIARYRFLALVFLWSLGLVQVLRADIVPSDLNPLQELLQGIERYTQSIDESLTKGSGDNIAWVLGQIEGDTSKLTDVLSALEGIKSALISSSGSTVVDRLISINSTILTTYSMFSNDIDNYFSKYFGLGYNESGFGWKVEYNFGSDGTISKLSTRPYSVFNYLNNTSSQWAFTQFLNYWNGQYFASVNTRLDSILDKIDLLVGGSGGSVSVDLSDLITSLQDLSNSLGWDRYTTQKAFWDSVIGLDSLFFSRVSFSDRSVVGIPFSVSSDSESVSVSSLSAFLSGFSSVQVDGFSRLNNNLVSLADLCVWSTTNIVSAINPGAYWGDPSEDLSQMETNKQFVVSVSSSGSSSTPAQSYEPVSTNDLGVIGVQISANTNKLYEVRSDEVASKYLRNPFGEASSSDSIGSVSSSGYEVLSIGGVEMDMEDAYNSFKTNFLDRVAPPLKTGFGALWVFLSVLFASIAIRKCVSGGV